MLSQLSRVTALNKTGLNAWLEATKVIAAGTEKFGRLQFEAVRSMLRGTAERRFELKNFTELPLQANTEAVAAAERALGYTRSMYDTAHATGVQLFGVAQGSSTELRKEWFAALEDLTEAAPGGKTGGTKSALDTTRTTVDAMVEEFTRTAKQSIELADAVVKTTSDSAAQAIKAIAPRG